MAAGTVQAQSGRLLLGSSVQEREGRLDLSLEFSCAMRYQGHLPGKEGADIRIRLMPGPDCGISPQSAFPTERLLPADDVGLVRSLELISGVTGGAELLVQWNRIEKFDVEPTGDAHALRIRVQRQKKSSIQVLVDDEKGAIGTYSVNLLSSKSPIPTAEVARARTLLGVPVFVSQTEVKGEMWNRLRAGPFFSKGAAEKVLREAQKSYSGVWVGIEDEAQAPDATRDDRKTVKPESGAPPQTLHRDPGLDAMLSDARAANGKKRYDEAVALLEKILLSPDYANRADAQELLGLVRERNKQFAHAKNEYEEYLRQYPDGPGAERVRARLRAVRQASLPGRKGTGEGGGGDEGWRIYGSVDQTWRRDNSQVRTDAQSRDFVSQNALISGVDLVARHRGERYDFTSRISAGYLNDFMPDGRGDQRRISVAYAELRDRERNWSIKGGRQSRGMSGLFNSFDGVLANWQMRPQLSFSVVAGLPVENSREGLDSHRRFVGVSADYANAAHTWDTSLYAIAQQYYGETDRQSVGVETRYLKSGRTLIALFDYDVHFSDVNNAMVLGTFVLPDSFTLNASAGHQRSPTLSLRNALVGQPVLTFDELRTMFTPSELEQLAKDRSTTLDQASIAISHPFGQRAQWTLSAYAVDISGMPASGGVDAMPAYGLDSSLTGEVLVNGLLREGDASTIAVRYQQGAGASTYSLGASNRMPLGASWRLLSRVRADHRELTDNGTVQWLYAPSFRLDFLRRYGQIEFEAGAEFGDRTTRGVTERNTRYFFSLGYRLSLDSIGSPAR
jgi:tetratricopeptide (TPR) repeat protein